MQPPATACPSGYAISYRQGNELYEISVRLSTRRGKHKSINLSAFAALALLPRHHCPQPTLGHLSCLAPGSRAKQAHPQA